MLTFRALLARESDPAGARSCSPARVEDMLNTVVRTDRLRHFETR